MFKYASILLILASIICVPTDSLSAKIKWMNLFCTDCIEASVDDGLSGLDFSNVNPNLRQLVLWDKADNSKIPSPPPPCVSGKG